MARFAIFALKEPGSHIIDLQFSRILMDDDAEYIDSVIADPATDNTRDTEVGCAPNLTVSREDVPTWRALLSLSFRHLQDHAGMTNQDSFIFRGWHGAE
jgi:hypothetical protein